MFVLRYILNWLIMEVEGSLPEAYMAVKCGEFTLLLLEIFVQ
jgi:hypothetical protein